MKKLERLRKAMLKAREDLEEAERAYREAKRKYNEEDERQAKGCTHPKSEPCVR